MKILGLYDHSGPKYHRIYLPIALMDIEYSLSHELTEENANVDIVFLNRVITNNSINNVLELKKKFGFKIVVDFDDHWRLDPSHLLHDVYKMSYASEIMEEYIKLADAVFVTHERLYNEVVTFNKNCHILPNAIPKVGQFLFKKQPDEKVRLFWAGGITHKNDIQILKEPLKRIYSKEVKLVMGGYSKGPEWKTMSSFFTNGGRFEHELIESLPVTEYYASYSKCDISLIPLVNNSFNIHKSNLKILEAANIESPVVVSKVNPYLNFPERVVNYVEKQSDWKNKSVPLIKSRSMREIQGAMLRDYCDEHFNFLKINEERKQILEYVAGKQREVREVQVSL